MTRAFLTAMLLAAAPTLGFQTAHAEPLDAATCGLLKGEQARLEQGGVRLSMMKGPEWAKANLTTGRLEEIRRLIELDEQVLFRCSGQKLVDLPADADADPPAKNPDAQKDGEEAASRKTDAGKDKAPAAAAKSPAATPKAKDSDKKAPAAAKAAPARAKEAPRKAAEPTKKAATPPPEKAAAAKPKPKPKVDDAYKPPPVNPNVDPFANQPARQ